MRQRAVRSDLPRKVLVLVSLDLTEYSGNAQTGQSYVRQGQAGGHAFMRETVLWRSE